jgi:acetyl-CoA carboxylase biotin carboxylase subunit
MRLEGRVFRRVLIANRGEIALRVVRACRELGIETVVVHSEADRDAPWLEGVDRAVCVGAASAAASYLNQDAILQVAEQEDCQAIHPGYGFLAENAVFAARCEQQGVSFVGPPAHAIRRMGDKALAKRTMSDAGLPTIPGSAGVLAGAAAAREEAERIGYPVLLKASAGGGGKGMRFCGVREDLDGAFAEATLEAEKAFGNPALYLEKFIVGARHIEFQVLVDAYGRGIHLGERECSIQRQHQKLIEESPSPAVERSERSELGERVASAVAAFGYRGAGTVEFLRSAEGHFYFMEMNTRLQVEHPVTEMLTGVDLVLRQLEVAAQRPLDLEQEAVAFRGHAIEFRINAEDPARGFRPDPGRISGFRPPTSERDGVTVRWDSAIRAGYRIPPHYDSLIGKLIVHGRDRQHALEGARDALSTLGIDGVRTTVDLHLRLLDDRGFRSGAYDIEYLSESGVLDPGEARA